MRDINGAVAEGILSTYAMLLSACELKANLLRINGLWLCECQSTRLTWILVDLPSVLSQRYNAGNDQMACQAIADFSVMYRTVRL